MNLKSNYWFDNLQGNWATKKSIYLIKNRVERKYEEKFNIEKNNKLNDSFNYKLKYILIKKRDSTLAYELSFVDSFINKLQQSYDIKFIEKDFIKIESKLINHSINCYEYIYFINKNLNISVSFLKKNNKYLMIVFTSYIRTSSFI